MVTPNSSNAGSRSLLPAELIETRWSVMHPQERAFATCLFDCVRLEHLLRKRLRDVTGDREEAAEATAPEGDLSDDDVKSQGSMEEPAPAASPKHAMGKVTWEFINHPKHTDLLLGIGMYYNLIKMVAFRNYLIHDVGSGKYTSGKLKKAYVGLQLLLYHLKRWPNYLAIHQALCVLIDEWFSQSGWHGPPTPAGHFITARRKGRSRARLLGISEDDSMVFDEALGMLVSSDPSRSSDELSGAAEKLLQLRPKWLPQPSA